MPILNLDFLSKWFNETLMILLAFLLGHILEFLKSPLDLMFFYISGVKIQNVLSKVLEKLGYKCTVIIKMAKYQFLLSK